MSRFATISLEASMRCCRTVAVAVALVATLIPVPRAAAAEPGAADGQPRYYVALGDSLSVGIQADGEGNSVPTDEGYTDQLYARLKAANPDLQLVELGCSGETTTSMIEGGICEYENGSQLADAVAFLRANRDAIALVTLDIGANDVSGCLTDSFVDLGCAAERTPTAARNLSEILAQLRLSGGFHTPIAAMNYYDPYLASWLEGPQGQLVARSSVEIATRYNDLLEWIYGLYGVPVADVETAFSTTDFSTTVPLEGVGPVPLNVARVCQWTWMCAPPRQPNIHPNTAGYAVIAATFHDVVTARWGPTLP
jgi:lysophospholipase L1-like esterase